VSDHTNQDHTVETVLATLSSFVGGTMSISELDHFMGELYDWSLATFEHDDHEDESLLWAVSTGLASILLDLYDRELTGEDVPNTRTAVFELIEFLREGEDAWREKVRSGWWPW
jgi:hypothetical protein